MSHSFLTVAGAGSSVRSLGLTRGTASISWEAQDTGTIETRIRPVARSGNCVLPLGRMIEYFIVITFLPKLCAQCSDLSAVLGLTTFGAFTHVAGDRLLPRHLLGTELGMGNLDAGPFVTSGIAALIGDEAQGPSGNQHIEAVSREQGQCLAPEKPQE